MDDAELLARLNGGADRDLALRELVGRYAPMIHAGAVRSLRDPNAADDVVQATFLVLLRRAKSLPADAPLGPWLYRVMRYAVADVRKKQRRRDRHESAAGGAIDRSRSGEASTDASIDDLEPRDRLAPLLHEAIDALPATDRAAVVLRYLQGQSHREASLSLGLSEPAVRQRLSRAMAKMRRFLADRGVTASEAMLGAALAIPAGGITTEALDAIVGPIVRSAGGGASGAATLTADGVLKTMRWNQIKVVAAVAIPVAAGLFLAATLVAQSTDPKSSDVMTGSPAGGAIAHVNYGVGTSQPTTSPAAVVHGAAKTPTDTVRQAYEAALAGDESGMLDCFAATTPAQQDKLRKVVQAFAAGEEVRRALVDRFGDEAGQAIGRQFFGVQRDDLDAVEERIEIDGQAAVVDMGQVGPGRLALMKQGDVWRIDPAVLDSLNDRVVTGLHARLPQLRAVADDVRAGRLATVEEAGLALRAAMGR